MLRKATIGTVVLAGMLVLNLSPLSAGQKSGLKEGTPELKSAGPLAFGPNGILFIGDSQGAAIVAVDTGDTEGTPQKIKVANVKEQIASLLGTTPRDILINDLAVNPASGNAYLSVSRGRGPDAAPVIVRFNREGRLSVLELKDIPFAKAALPNAPSPDAKDRRNRSLRSQSITDLAYVDGRVFVAGLSNEEFASKLRSIPFPFTETNEGTSVEIFHGAHGRFETGSPVRTFAPYKIDGQPHLLAAYTCTPLVKFPVADLKPGQKIKGTTVAELGNRNRPLDMVIYQQDGKDYVLMANSNRGMMKISTEQIAEIDGIEKKIDGTAGLGYQTIQDMQGVEQLDRLSEDDALVLVQSGNGDYTLETVALP